MGNTKTEEAESLTHHDIQSCPWFSGHPHNVAHTDHHHYQQKSNENYPDSGLDRLPQISDACWVSHQGFFHGTQKQPSPLVFVIIM